MNPHASVFQPVNSVAKDEKDNKPDQQPEHKNVPKQHDNCTVIQDVQHVRRRIQYFMQRMNKLTLEQQTEECKHFVWGKDRVLDSKMEKFTMTFQHVFTKLCAAKIDTAVKTRIMIRFLFDIQLMDMTVWENQTADEHELGYELAYQAMITLEKFIKDHSLV
jgi:hypothetical protein